MKTIIFLYTVLVLTSFACKKEVPKKIDIIAPVVPNDSALNIIWKTPMPYQSSSFFTTIYNNVVIFSIEETQGSFKDVFIGYDKTNGKELWKTTQSFWIPSNFFQKENILYFESGGNLYSIDLASGKILWQVKRPGDYSVMAA